MTVAPTPLPSRASRSPRADRPVRRPIRRLHDAVHPLELAAIAGLIRDNERLIETLSAIAAQVVEARCYLDTPGSNTRLAMAYLGRLKAKRSHVLGRLRSNKIEADRALGDAAAPSFKA